MTHTPEPWTLTRDTYGVQRIWATESQQHEVVDVASTVGDGSLSGQEQTANAERIVACVNGCAGLNPAAYQDCVEALKAITNSNSYWWQEAGKEIADQIQIALALAEARP